ncbi:hypothetical protein COY90_01740 [Candidatus Roizmanbacteria bacterium CG_4_10_14_0_8_um_filter_39_9]|uniref:AB hydrolase-1 domain-containing protein n=1 Tax=Candidatus Roizmanbacteria bacterium CG_4_10_14_0_8_um_filter_39_9 TaxID=1974829 RepID=A0A2M7QDD3_9BACT|nr:MAG: hypothetical protein COY90_01740 [Candidatus Roizmanbacteria bacterium CG_4_10_14_0_8_um_filter_39_9]
MIPGPAIYNSSREKIDTLVEGLETAPVTVVLVHGIGTDKHETAGQFDDISKGLHDKYRTIRFDFSGFGKSEGRMEDFDYYKHADDLKSVLDYVKQTFSGQIYIVAQSMGTFITALLNPKGIERTVFMGIPNSNTSYIIELISKRWGSKPGAHIDMNGVSLVPRTSGAIQRFGAKFWTSLKNFNPVGAVTAFSKNTHLLILHPLQDELVGQQFLEAYKSIQNVAIEHINGDHSFRKTEDRTALIARIRTFFNSDTII